MKYDIKKYLQELIKFSRSKENRKNLILITIITIIILLVQIVSFQSVSGNYLVSKTGEIIGIKRNDMSQNENYYLKVKGMNGKLSLEKEVLISLKNQSEKNSDNKVVKETGKTSLKRNIENTVNKIGKTKEQVVILPKALEDGTKLHWEKSGKTINFSAILLFPLLIFFTYRSKIHTQRKSKEKRIANIKKSLPAFNNQLLLLLNSGLIFSDAFERIAKSYMTRDVEQTFFTTVITNIYNNSKETNSSLVLMLSEYSRSLGIREMTRITNIIVDNQYKGVNLTEKLERESEILWGQRKKMAEEKGKLAESKLTFPLALLLLVLILITAAPAILQI